MGSPRRASAQHIVITGASGGLGSALAFAYAGPDIRLTLSGRREKRLADIMADETSFARLIPHHETI